MAENRGCLGAFIAMVVVAALGVVLLGLAAGGWFWYSNTSPRPGGAASGPWMLTVDNPNTSAITVSCALESAAPTEVGPGEKVAIQVTSLPVMCTGTTTSGVRVVDFTTTSPPADGRGWSTVATVEAGPPDPVVAEPQPEPEVKPLKPGLAPVATRKAPPVAAKVVPEPAPAPAPKRTAPVIFRYPPGPKFAEVEVSVDGNPIGTHPNGATLTIGSHSVQFYKDGVVNISCPIEVLPEGRVVALNRKLTCPSPIGP